MAEEKKTSPLDESQKTSKRWSGYLGWAFITIVLIWVVFPKIQRLLETEAAATRAEERQHVIPEAPSKAEPLETTVGRDYGQRYERPKSGDRFSPVITILGTNGVWLERDGDPRKTTFLPPPNDPNAHLVVIGGENGVRWRFFRLKTGGGYQKVLIHYEE